MIYIRSILVVLTVVATPLLRAQGPDYQGMTGGAFVGGARFRLDDAEPAAQFAGGLSVGYRFRLFDIGMAPVSLTPHIALTITRFRGIALNSDEIAFARLDKMSSKFEPAMQLAIRLGGWRPYLLSQPGEVMIERYVKGTLLNYSGNGRALGIGVERPGKNACGAGPNISVRSMSANLTKAERRGTDTPPAGGAVRATIVSVGWSGRFRGTRLLFAC